MSGIGLALGLFATHALALADNDELEWIKNKHFDLVGKSLPELREIEQLSSTVIAGCAACLNWPDEFPQRILVQIADQGIPQVNRGAGGGVSLKLISGATREVNSEWLTRSILTRFGIWKGIDTPPPLWLVHATMVMGSIESKPQIQTLLLRRLRDQGMPSLAQRIQTYDRTSDFGWDYLVYRFLESGGFDREIFRQRVERFWANGYDWTQLSIFFLPRYENLNPAELELLWRTFLGETFSSVTERIVSEADSLQALDSLSKIEVLLNQKPEILAPDSWFLFRNNDLAHGMFRQRQSELEVLVVSIHPYYFNACHSLNAVVIAVIEGDLKNYREAVRRWNQDMLDAQQLSFETDRLLERLCP